MGGRQNLGARGNLSLGILALLASTSLSAAGPCTKQIEDFQARFDSKLNVAAAKGPTGEETAAATLHHQPTPQSVGHAEEKLGDIPHDKADAFADALLRARGADESDDKAGCENALRDAQAALK